MPEFADIIEPSAITWWPPAWGWWLVALLALLTISAAAVLLMRWIRQRQVAALTRPLLATALERYNENASSEIFCRDLNQVLKRYIAYQHPQSPLLAKTGYEWTDALTQMADIFSDDTVQALAQGVYRPMERLRPEQHATEVRQWVSRVSGATIRKWANDKTGHSHA